MIVVTGGAGFIGSNIAKIHDYQDKDDFLARIEKRDRFRARATRGRWQASPPCA